MILTEQQEKALTAIGFLFVRSEWVDKHSYQYEFGEKTWAEGFDPDIPNTLYGRTKQFYGVDFVKNKWVLEIDSRSLDQCYYLTLDDDAKGFEIFYTEHDGDGSPAQISFDLISRIKDIIDK